MGREWRRNREKPQRQNASTSAPRTVKVSQVVRDVPPQWNGNGEEDTVYDVATGRGGTRRGWGIVIRRGARHDGRSRMLLLNESCRCRHSQKRNTSRTRVSSRLDRRGGGGTGADAAGAAHWGAHHRGGRGRDDTTRHHHRYAPRTGQLCIDSRSAWRCLSYHSDVDSGFGFIHFGFFGFFFFVCVVVIPMQ